MSRIGELVLEIVNFQGSGEEYEQYVRGVLPELVNDHLAIESIDTEENGICILHLVRHWAMTKPVVFAVGAHLCVVRHHSLRGSWRGLARTHID